MPVLLSIATTLVDLQIQLDVSLDSPPPNINTNTNNNAIKISRSGLFENVSYKLSRGPGGIVDLLEIMSRDRMLDASYLQSVLYNCETISSHFPNPLVSRALVQLLVTQITKLFGQPVVQELFLNELLTKNLILLPPKTGIYHLDMKPVAPFTLAVTVKPIAHIARTRKSNEIHNTMYSNLDGDMVIIIILDCVFE
jgi:hypothetical protein